MFRQDIEIQKVAESRTQVDLDAIADDAFSRSDDDEKKYEAFEAGYNLGKSAGIKDVWEVVIPESDSKDSIKMSYFFIGSREEVIEKLKMAPAAEEAKDEEVPDTELKEAMDMEGQ
jgi:hypothetical protein